MKKIKGFSGIKVCKDGQLYKFKNGWAIVPGFKMPPDQAKGIMRLFKYPVSISLKEFNQLNGA